MKKMLYVSTKTPTTPDPKNLRLIWIVVAFFSVQIAVWVSWIAFATKHKVTEVPLTTAL